MDSEQEELEALKKWWRDNGRAVVVGLVLGLGGVFAWTTWNARVEAAAEQLSVLYEGVVNAAAANDNDTALQQAEVIVAENPDSEYAALAGLVAAKSALALGRPEDAERLLAWVADNAGLEELRNVARVRSAQLLAATGRHDAALETLAKVDAAAFAATVNELQGDVLSAKDDAEGAAEAYRAALAAGSSTTAAHNRLRIKLDSLGVEAAPAPAQ